MKSRKGFALIISLVLAIGIVLPGTLALSTDQTSSNGTIEVPTETTTPAPEAQQEQEGQNEQENNCTCGSTDGTVPETTVPETGTAASEQPEAPMEQKSVSTDERYTVSFDLGGGILTARGVDRSVTAAPGETIILPGAPEKEDRTFTGWLSAKSGETYQAEAAYEVTDDDTLTAQWNMLQVLVFAIIVGIACLTLGEKPDPFVRVCEAVDAISVKIVSAVMYTTPVGVFCSLAGTVHANGLQAILSLAAVLSVLYLVMALYIVIVYGFVMVRGIGRFSLKRFFVTVLPAALNAFGTASSSATLPISKRCADEMEVPNEISALALPLGATINMDAVSIVMSFMIVFFANATGTELPYGLLAVVLLSNTLLSIGAPGVPNSAIASFAALAAIAGLPAGIMGMYVSVNILVDAGATCCNVLGDIACAVAMKRSCPLPKKKA